MIAALLRMTGSSEDELDTSRTGITSGEDDSMDSTMIPHQPEPNLSSSEPLNLLQPEFQNEKSNEEENPSRNSPSDDLIRRNAEIENLRIRSVDQLLSPESLKLQEHLKVSDVDKINGNLRMSVDTMRVKSREGMLTPGVVPQELKVREKGGGVWVRKEIPKGTRYGPFLGKWLGEPIDPRFAWEVVAGSGVRGWLDATLDNNNWLKFIRTTNQSTDITVQHFLQGGQMWYETCKDVSIGEELLLGPREPLQLQDMLGDSTTSDDRSDRETASQHSGTVDDEREDADDEESETRCSVCEKPFNDIDQLDEHLISAHRYPADQYRCELCPKSYSHRPCLLRHRAVVHGDLRKYPCENCTKEFTDPSNLQRHIRTHHVGARSHACPECGKTFATSSGLKQHTHIHSSVKPFQCEVCFKAYTQFSNLCRHKRMHADCRMQIKCVKCNQSFSTVTSLSKHKRFCDSTNPTPGLPHPHPAQHSMPALPMPNNNQNPFLMYRPPAGIPFFPTAFNPYNPILHPSLHPSEPPPGFFNNPLLFNQFPKLPTEDNQKMLNSLRRLSSLNQSQSQERRSPNPKERCTPPPNNHLMAKVSPPTAEEASSHLTPSPARPPLSSNSNIFNNPREQLNTKNREEENNTPKDLSRRTSPILKLETEVDVKSEATTDNESNEQPLDLTTGRKHQQDEDDVISVKEEPMKVDTPQVHSPPIKQIILSMEEKQEQMEIEESNKRQRETPPQLYNKLSVTPPMAYPRPIHPTMLFEAMCRPPGFHGFPGPPSGSDRLLPPPSPFGPPRGFPFLGAFSQQRQPLEMLRPGIPGFGNVKPFQDVMGPHQSNNKMKDRYACKFCGKVFPRSANLTRHLRTHTGEQPYKCKYCERSFSISSNLQRHVRNIHNKEKPFKCPLCERCFGQQTNLDRHLKKHEADDGSGVVAVADSPGSSNENEREDAYFDEIRSFMGKVTYSGVDPYNQTHLYTPPHLNSVIDVVGKDDEDSESYSEDPSPTEDIRTRISLDNAFESNIKKEKDEMFNNNVTSDQSIQIST